MKKLIILAAFAIMTNTCWSQTDLKAKKFDNPKWKYVVHVDFREGKNDRAKTIINDYFEKAAKKAGTPTPEMALQMYSGEWDMMLVWAIKGGIEDLNWETSPDDVNWMKALAEIAGGADKAKAILEEWQGLINRTSSQLAKNY